MTNFVELAQGKQASEFQDNLNTAMAEKVAAALLDKKAEVASTFFQPVEEAVGHIEKGAFHRWLGKSEDEPITAADIAKGKAAGGHAEKMAIFAQNFGHGKPQK